MFYKYPEEFIVPVIYSEELKVECNNLYRNSVPVEEVVENSESDLMELNPSILKEPFQESGISNNIVSDNLDDEKIKDIINEIDDEYANNEIGIV